jgi:alkanesulfonate monooxygenase SsuD/methylene tetrahydromethanopterin reductase-like flavin-dependent oxidoreductase (luciferase family)
MPNAAFDEVLERFKYVEDLGFELATTGDHFVDWTEPSRPWLEAWTTLAGIARETTTLRLATYVTQYPLRNPAMMAREALTLDHISNGRIEVGLGTGLTIDPVYDMIGIENHTPGERVDRLREYVQVVDQLLSNETTSYSGEYFEIKEAVMNPRPIQAPRPPIVIAALGPRMLRLAAEYADNWNTLSFAEDFEAQLAETKGRIDRVIQCCEELGRDPETLRFSYQMFDPASRASGGEITYYKSENLFVDMVQRLMELGITELGLYFPLLDSQRPTFEHIATDILPGLRD